MEVNKTRVGSRAASGTPAELGFRTERVTGVEPALSAWESDRSRPMTALTWALDAPLVTVVDLETPGLMARQWPGSRRSQWRASPLQAGTHPRVHSTVAAGL